jgi:hypothetical protein
MEDKQEMTECEPLERSGDRAEVKEAPLFNYIAS